MRVPCISIRCATQTRADTDVSKTLSVERAAALIVSSGREECSRYPKEEIRKNGETKRLEVR